MKKIIFYQSCFNPIGGVETMAYNWCWWMRNYFDITVLYCFGDYKRLSKMKRLVKMELYDENKEYECDIFIRNSVWGVVPHNIKATRMIEMRHANYKYLLDKGLLFQQYKDMGIKEIVGCGEFVSKMSHEALGDNPTTIKNILLPKQETNKILHLISCTRLDSAKGWNRMQQMMWMLREAKIKFEWNIFTNLKQACSYEEVHFWKQRYDIWDYLADADYTVLLSDSEGLPYTIQESLEYKVPCIVTDVGGCTELIKDGVNGYVVPLDMNFDINKIKVIPKCEEYDNHALEDWLKFLEYDGEIKDEKILIENFKEEENSMKAKVRCIFDPFYDDIELKERKKKGDEYIVPLERAEYLRDNNAVEILEIIKEEPKEEKKTELKKVMEDIGEVINKNIEVEEVEPLKAEAKPIESTVPTTSAKKAKPKSKK